MKQMTFDVNEVLTLDTEKMHEAVMTNMTIKQSGEYMYLQIETTLVDGVTLNVGYNITNGISRKTELGKLLTKAGLEFAVGDKLTEKKIWDILTDRKVKYSIYEENGFYQIDKDSIEFL